MVIKSTLNACNILRAKFNFASLYLYLLWKSSTFLSVSWAEIFFSCIRSLLRFPCKILVMVDSASQGFKMVASSFSPVTLKKSNVLYAFFLFSFSAASFFFLPDSSMSALGIFHTFTNSPVACQCVDVDYLSV